MESLRWYDNDKYLSAFMEALKSMPHNLQSKSAREIMDEIPNVLGENCEKFIQHVESSDPEIYNRWYDTNPYLHFVLEAVKHMTQSEKSALYANISAILAVGSDKNEN